MSFRSLVTDLLGGRVGLLKSTTTLTDAQIKALPTTPIQLVAAPGAGYRILPISITARCNTTAGAYTNIDGAYAAVQFIYAGDTAWPMTAIVKDTGIGLLTSFLAGSAHYIHTATTGLNGYDAGAVAATPEYTLTGLSLVADVENKAFQVSMDNNGTGNLTGGHASNAMAITLYYLIDAVS